MILRSSWLPLLGANVLIPIAILVFATGFFPYKPFLAGLAEYESLLFGHSPLPPFDKVVFMVVDALRSDFVFSSSSGFSFTQSLISNGSAIPFTAHATAPTITMPRIKAITTGSTPSFLDLILNFAESDTSSTLATQDTWLAQMKAKRTGKLVMYGDDTWLKLFPDTFDRADGTSSFFVSDFTEVDNNVTRHVPQELEKDDWNTMVLHYLGLDHIGHKGGPRSPNMLPKQIEMDGIVKQVYEAICTKSFLENTLLVLLGDHGMNDAGNHGGSAAGETSPALVFVSPKLQAISKHHVSLAPAPYQEGFEYYKKVEQSDIAPTLGALLGFPSPRNNLGVVIPEFLDLWNSDDEKAQLLLSNAHQIKNVVSATFPSFWLKGSSLQCEGFTNEIQRLSCQWHVIQKSSLSIKDFVPTEGTRRYIYNWSKDAQRIMSSAASNYNVTKLLTAQVVAWLSLALALTAVWLEKPGQVRAFFTFFGITILYGFMTFASSYVEEEHHFWYWISTAWLSLLWVKGYRRRWLNPHFMPITYIFILTVTRIARRWNQTGQKFAGSDDIARTFFSGHRTILWALVGITYLWNLNSLVTVTFARFGQLIAGTLGSALMTAALHFKLAFTNEDSPELLVGLAKAAANTELGVSLVTLARIIFGGITITAIISVVNGFVNPQKAHITTRTLHDLLTLFLMTQSRATNIPLLLLFSIQFFFLLDLNLTVIEITTTSLLLQQFSFFAFGNSNAISSIDLSSAYNGVAGYNVLVVGILTFVSNWTGPIFWTSATTIMLLRLHRRGVKDVLFHHLTLLTVFTTTSLVFVMVACTKLRTHLFIWTVFSPKYLYAMAWSLGQHLGVNLGLGSLLFWLGAKYQEREKEEEEKPKAKEVRIE